MSSNKFELKIPKHREFLGGDLLAQSLTQLGVNVAFGLHGGHLDAFLYGCADAGIDLIDTRHETVAVQAAESYAKVSNKVGVCFITANSGFCNGLPGLSTAFADRSPIFCITSSPPLRDAETNTLQGFHDQVVLAQPITKFAHRVTNVEEIPRLVAYGFRQAMSGAPGPVLLDCPIDVLFSPPIMNRISYGAITKPLAYPPAANPEAVEETLKLWKAAKRPVIITGTGARGPNFSENLLKLAEQTNTPVFYSSKMSNSIPYKHKLRGGPATRLALLPMLGKEQPDLVILIGARTGFLLGGRGGAVLPNEGCSYVQVDTDGAEIGKSHPIDVGIVSTSESAVDAFLKGSDGIKGSDDWAETAGGLKDVKSPFADQETTRNGRAHPYHAVKALFDALPEGSIFLLDGGEIGGWSLQLLEHARPSIAMASTGYLGFLGNGWGYALGAAVADPSRQVVLVTGDGAAGFHLAELDTFARFKLKILTVIGNNFVWGMSQAGQELIYGEQNPIRQASKLNPKAEYQDVATALQCAGAKTEKLDEIAPAVKKLLDSGKPGLLNMIISDGPTHSDTEAMVNPTDDPNWIVVPYYDNVPRPFYKN